MPRTPATTDSEGLVWISGTTGQPKWSGATTTGLGGRYCYPKQGQSSYFMVAPDGHYCAQDAPWVRKNEQGGWDVVYLGEALANVRTKGDAQREAESLLGI